MTPMLKFFKVPKKFLNFGKSPKYTITFYCLLTTLFIIKFGSDQMKHGGNQDSTIFEIFAPIGSNVNKNESYPQSLAWLHEAASEKPEFTDNGRTMDACTMTVALLTKSSRAKRIKIEGNHVIRCVMHQDTYTCILVLCNRFPAKSFGNMYFHIFGTRVSGTNLKYDYYNFWHKSELNLKPWIIIIKQYNNM